MTEIAAPVERCFDLARDVGLHVRSAIQTGERVVSGKADGLLELGDEITFEARHLGVRQRLSARITAFDRPAYFQDRMLRGAFRSLEHVHRFEVLPNGRTRMTDDVRFVVPFGPLGWPIGRWMIAPHLTRFLRRRGDYLKAVAEALG